MILMGIICFQAPSLASALTGGAALQQGIHMVQNSMMVAGIWSAAGARAGSAGGGAGGAAGGVIRAGAGVPYAAGRVTGAAAGIGARFAGTMATGAGAFMRQGLRNGPNCRLQACRAARPYLNHPRGVDMRFFRSLAIGLFGASAIASVHAQGIPVIDVANLVQTITQVMNDVTEIENQVQQITQLQNQLSSINGARNLGNVFNSPSLTNYVPANAYTFLNAVNTSGYTGLSPTAKSLRDAGMVYNCMDLSGGARTNCQAILASRTSRRACSRTPCDPPLGA